MSATCPICHSIKPTWVPGLDSFCASDWHNETRKFRVQWSDDKVFTYDARSYAHARRMATIDRQLPRISEITAQKGDSNE